MEEERLFLGRMTVAGLRKIRTSTERVSSILSQLTD